MATLVLVDSPQKLATLRHYADNPAAYRWAPISSGIDWLLDIYRSHGQPQLPIDADRLRREAEGCTDVMIASAPDAVGDAMARLLAEGLDRPNGKVMRLPLPTVDRRQFHAQGVRSVEWRRSAVCETLLQIDRRVDAALRQLVPARSDLPVLGLTSVAALARIASKERAAVAEEGAAREHLSLYFDGLKPALPFRLTQINGKPPTLNDRNVFKALVIDLKEQTFAVENVHSEEKRMPPPPPLNTGALLAAAERELGFSAQKTLSLAFALYEGCTVGLKQPVGLISYPLTAATTVSAEAALAVREHILVQFGKAYLPEQARHTEEHAGQRLAAIGPTAVGRTPKKVKKYLSDEALQLYTLIWRRFLLAQMTDMKSLVRRVSVFSEDRRYLAVAETEQLLERGFWAACEGMPRITTDRLEEIRPHRSLKPVSVTVEKEQPACKTYGMGDLLEELTLLGICLPEQLILVPETLHAWGFIESDGLRLTPEGRRVYRLLQTAHAELFNLPYLVGFFRRLAECSHHDGSAVGLLTDFAKLLEAQPQQTASSEEHRFYGRCGQCGHDLIVKVGRFGRFLACSNFPRCTVTKPFPIGVRCPAEGCTGEVIERTGKQGSIFYACNRYPNCRFSSRFKPVNAACPCCGNAYLVVFHTAGQLRHQCPKCKREFADDGSELKHRTGR